MKFISQKQDTTCVPVAMKNCAIYLNKKFNLKKYIKFCCCDNGAAIRVDEAIKHSRLPLKKTKLINKIFKNGGIITIMHPIVNLHSIFCYPVDNKVTLINSWLGSNEFKLFTSKIIEYLATEPNRKMWYIDEKR